MNREHVKVFSFLSGQEVIGEATWQDGGYKVTNPFIVAQRPGPNGSIGLGLIPWPILADPKVIKETGIVIYSDNLVCEPYKPNDQLLTGYTSQVTGLAMPQSSPLILTETN